jgi:NADPH:quinone reductase-like Zn-dependent oxidoreductase
MSSNEAAWLNAQKAPLEVKPAPYPTPAEDELVIKNGAIAINPIDWIGQESLSMAFSWIKPPFIMGTDAAGEVVQVGSSVTRFKVGDRVVCHCVGANKKYNTAAKGAFQLYPVALERMTSPIPDRCAPKLYT